MASETIADIAAEMRGMGNYQQYSGDHARQLADRIEEAWRCEREEWSSRLRPSRPPATTTRFARRSS